MTNILLLSIVVWMTNATGRGALESGVGENGNWAPFICGSAQFNYSGPAGVYRLQWLPELNSSREWLWLDQPFTNPVTGSNSITLPLPPFDPEFPQQMFRLVWNPSS